MNRILSIAAAAFAALVSNIAAAEGGSYSAQPSAGSPGASQGQSSQGTGAQKQQTAPDNTGRNEPDRQAGKLEATDQSNDPRDVEMTRKIRRALTDDDSLSVNAQNIKVITVNGKVTLRGPVQSEDERRRIEAAARRAAGSATVVNELEVNQR